MRKWVIITLQLCIVVPSKIPFIFLTVQNLQNFLCLEKPI